jgi:hypothetical protein
MAASLVVPHHGVVGRSTPPERQGFQHVDAKTDSPCCFMKEGGVPGHVMRRGVEATHNMRSPLVDRGFMVVH